MVRVKVDSNSDYTAELAYINDQISKRELKECVPLTLDLSTKSNQANLYRQDVQSLRHELAYQTSEMDRDESELSRLNDSVAAKLADCRESAVNLKSLGF
jgi:hypothetical protein